MDNYFAGRRDNIAHLIGDPSFEAMCHDVTMPNFVEVDQIYNLACPASPIHYQLDPVQTTKVSVMGAINMLGLAKRNLQDGRVVSNFIVEALRGDDLMIYGDGSKTRAFCYVDDLVDGLIRLMDTPGEFSRSCQPREST